MQIDGKGLDSVARNYQLDRISKIYSNVHLKRLYHRVEIIIVEVFHRGLNYIHIPHLAL